MLDRLIVLDHYRGHHVGDRGLLAVIHAAELRGERAYNGLRLAGTLAKRGDHGVRVFLMGGAVLCARQGQQTAKGYYNLANMIRLAVQHGAEVGLCGSCLDARGLHPSDLVEGARRSSMDALADWTLGADRIVTF